MRLDDIVQKDKKLAIGLMSGTSLDGIDTCLVEISGYGVDTKVNLIDFISIEYTPQERDIILKLCSPVTSNVASICKGNIWIGKKFGNAAKKIMDKNNIDASTLDFVASHGQTIYHMPECGATLQIGELAEIATITGCLTIGDFRPSDMAVGGQGAPLVPYTDYVLFTDENKGRILINIGGISNMTALNAGASKEDILAFDCGPGNMLIDRIITILTDGEFTYDNNGERAMRGSVNEKLLEEILNDDKFIYETPPKSTGREKYNDDMVHNLINKKDKYNLGIEDFVATITAYTYMSITHNIKEFITKYRDIKEIYIGGGGAKNHAILKGIKENIDIDVYTMEDLKFSSDAKEAIAFAILGNEFLNHRANNLKTATGAFAEATMGKMVLPPFL